MLSGQKLVKVSHQPEHFVELCCCLELDNSYRIFNCVLCAAQVILCRSCDRGNQYCSDTCAKEQRRRSNLRAGMRYQRTFAGRRAHASRQQRYRQRVAAKEKKVTQQGSAPLSECASKSMVAAVHEKPAIERTLREAIRCHQCGRECGQFARFEFWRGGRGFKKLRRLHDRKAGDRGGDHSPVPR